MGSLKKLWLQACLPVSFSLSLLVSVTGAFLCVNFNTCLMRILMIWLQWHNYIIGMYCACWREGVLKVLGEWRYINRIIMMVRWRMWLMRKWLENLGRNGHCGIKKIAFLFVNDWDSFPLGGGGSKDHWKEVGSDGLSGRLLWRYAIVPSHICLGTTQVRLISQLWFTA